MITYSDLFTFVIMLCAVITLVVTLFTHKKYCLPSGKLRHYFSNFCLPAARCTLANGSLVKYIIIQLLPVCQSYIMPQMKIKDPALFAPGRILSC